MGNSRTDKGQDFIDAGMTLITETDSDRYLDAATKSRRAKQKEELHPMPEDLVERPSKGAGGFNDFVERWSD